MGTPEDKCFDVALQLVKQAGSIIREAYNQPRSRDKQIETKASDVDLVTESDKKVEEMLFHSLAKEFPDHKFIGEESAAAGVKTVYTDDPTWIIDPIDGTTNFVHRMPFVCVSVGLAIKKKIVIGIIYNPIMEDLYTARVGGGAYKNGFPISTSGTTKPGQTLVLSTVGSQRRTDVFEAFQHNFRWFMDHGARGHRSLGSAALNMCYVAQGSVDCFVEYGLHCWDMAAGWLIVEEAGGSCIDPPGGPFNLMKRSVLCASSEQLAKTLSSSLVHVDYPLEYE